MNEKGVDRSDALVGSVLERIEMTLAALMEEENISPKGGRSEGIVEGEGRGRGEMPRGGNQSKVGNFASSAAVDRENATAGLRRSEMTADGSFVGSSSYKTAENVDAVTYEKLDSQKSENSPNLDYKLLQALVQGNALLEQQSKSLFDTSPSAKLTNTAAKVNNSALLDKLAPSSSSVRITSQFIQQLLDENQQMLYAIHENHKIGRTNDTTPLFARLQQNLMFLALLADQQPPLEESEEDEKANLSSDEYFADLDFWTQEEVDNLHKALKQPNQDLIQLSAAVKTKTPSQVNNYIKRSAERYQMRLLSIPDFASTPKNRTSPPTDTNRNNATSF